MSDKSHRNRAARKAQRGSDRLSEVFERLAGDESRARITVGDILDALRDRASGGLMLVFALPNVAPLPPGASAVLGIPLILLSAQLLVGGDPWLPGIVRRQSVPRTTFSDAVERATPWLVRLERLLRPRWTVLVKSPGENVVGGVCLLLSIVLALPVPLGNLPPAIAICLMALALVARDGAFVVVGIVAAVMALSLAWGATVVVLHGLALMIQGWAD